MIGVSKITDGAIEPISSWKYRPFASGVPGSLPFISNRRIKVKQNRKDLMIFLLHKEWIEYPPFEIIWSPIRPDTNSLSKIPVKERIHVCRDPRDPEILRTDHLFRFWRFRWLQLHYKIARKAAAAAIGPNSEDANR